MKMGIKEFRERIGEVALGDEAVVVTHHGRRVGQYIPDSARKPPKNIDLDAWVKERLEFGRRWRARTPDWREKLRALGEPEEDIAALAKSDECS
jgi:monoamine oxidase